MEYDALSRRAEEVAKGIQPYFVRCRCDHCGGVGTYHRPHPNDDPRLDEDPCGQCDGRRLPGARYTHAWRNHTLANQPSANDPRHSDADLVRSFYSSKIAGAYPTLATALEDDVLTDWFVLDVEELAGDACQVLLSNRFRRTGEITVDRDFLRDRGRGADLGRQLKDAVGVA